MATKPILEPSKAPAAQWDRRVRSVFPKKNSGFVDFSTRCAMKMLSEAFDLIRLHFGRFDAKVLSLLHVGEHQG